VLRGEALSIGLSVAFNLLLYRYLGVLVIGLAIAVGSVASLAYYLASLRFSLPRTRRSVLPLLAGLPLYLLASAAVRQWLGSGMATLLLQVPLLFVFWGVLLLRKDLRALLKEERREGTG
jgi:hypothetical protein